MKIERSKLAGYRTALIEWLGENTAIQWDFYRSYVLPGDGAKGAVFVTRSQSDTAINYQQSTNVVSLRLLLADNDHQEAHCLQLDWGDELLRVMRRLSKTGVTGTHRGVQLYRAFMGVRLTQKGISYYLEDSSQRADLPEGIALATLNADYEFIIESGIELD